MSTYADPNKAFAWIDGDAFRAPAGTELPADPFTAELEGWDAFGGIEAGFTPSAEQTVNKKKVFNYRQAAYKVLRDPLDEGITFRAVDNSQATKLTRAQGGTITLKEGREHLVKGDGEDFALIVRLSDGDDSALFYWQKGTLSAPPTRAAIDGQSIDGWEFAYTGLVPVVEILPASTNTPTDPPVGG